MLEYQNQILFGTGLKGTVNVDKSDDELNGRIGLTNLWIFDSRYSLGGSIYANDYDWDTYEEEAYGFILTGGRQLGRNTAVSLSYVLEHSDITVKPLTTSHRIHARR